MFTEQEALSFLAERPAGLRMPGRASWRVSWDSFRWPWRRPRR